MSGWQGRSGYPPSRRRGSDNLISLIRSAYACFLLFSSRTARAVSTSSTGQNSRLIHALYAGQANRWDDYQQLFQKSFREAGLNVRLSNEYSVDPSLFHYVIYHPNGPISDFSSFKNIKAVFNLRAGVEGVVDNPTIKVPLCRMVDQNLQDGMVEYVIGHTFRHHLQTDNLWRYKNQCEWRQSEATSCLAKERTVGILGLGGLGTACADALVRLNFRVLGWSRRSKHHTGVECRSGPEGLDSVLSESDILVLLLPNTPETENIIRKESLEKCKPGVAIINAGRGDLIDDNALLEALESGKVSGATLDVFREEPLHPDHGFWRHPRLLVTPHIAAKTSPKTAGPVIAENIRRCECGEPLLYMVDKESGY